MRLFVFLSGAWLSLLGTIFFIYPLLFDSDLASIQLVSTYISTLYFRDAATAAFTLFSASFLSFRFARSVRVLAKSEVYVQTWENTVGLANCIVVPIITFFFLLN